MFFLQSKGGFKMPKREDINTVLVIGSGPIIIGQACEFDYSGTQACKALRGLGYKIVLVNSNPATIMTDPETADVTYIEPLNVERLTQIIEKERPDALLPNLGGQSALNLCSELSNAGVLDKYNVQVLGVKVDAIERGEDRLEFKKAMNELGIEMARSEIANTVDEALAIADKLGYPVVVRPAYTMGGAGGGLVYNVEELRTVVNRGLQASLVHQCLIEESILGWEELELEVVRDAKNNMITICFIENIDPLGVHTGDSFCSAPMLTISKEVQDRLQEQAYRIVESIGVIGGTNVQFAHDPVTDRIVVIEINPRTSRSSALASKATGFPIALVSAMLAAGLTLDEIPCGKYGTLDKYYPDGDYVVIKFARWAFEKFKAAEDKLGTQMKAVGEVMSIGKTYKEAFQKAIRSLETGRYGLGYAKNFNDLSKDELLKLLINPTSERQFIMYEALRKGATVDELFDEQFKINAENQNKQYELMSGITDIKLNAYDDYKMEEWRALQERSYRMNVKILKLGQIQDTGFTMIGQLRNIFITCWIAAEVVNGNLTLGMMMSISAIIGLVNGPLSQLIGFLQQFQDAKISLERSEEVHLCSNEDSALQSEVPSDVPMDIEVRDLTFSYTGSIGKPALENASFTIPAGKMTAIVGESGSGKTTLMKLLLKFYEPTKGEIYLGGKSLAGYSAKSMRRVSGIVMQDNFIFSDSIKRNVILGEEEDDIRLKKALSMACLDAFIENQPLGVNTKIGAEGIGVSGGEKQRIMIARAAYKRPVYLMLDEATSSLDAENERKITENIGHAFENHTRIVIAHRLSTVRNADQIIVLRHGKVVEQGTHAELTKLHGYYYQLIHNQLELATD